MRFALRAGITAAALAPAIAAFASCGPGGHLPPAPPVKDAGGSGGSGSGGGAGGTSGGGSGGAAVTAKNPCECVVASYDSGGPCSTCLNSASSSTCLPALQACQGDPGCVAIVQCTDGCAGDSACVLACVLPFDADASHELYYAAADCTCDACASKCSPDAPLTCPAPTGSGGAGGSGGSGGSGGAGGPGGAGGAGGSAGSGGGGAGGAGGAGGN